MSRLNLVVSRMNSCVYEGSPVCSETKKMVPGVYLKQERGSNSASKQLQFEQELIRKLKSVEGDLNVNDRFVFNETLCTPLRNEGTNDALEGCKLDAMFDPETQAGVLSKNQQGFVTGREFVRLYGKDLLNASRSPVSVRVRGYLNRQVAEGLLLLIRAGTFHNDLYGENYLVHAETLQLKMIDFDRENMGLPTSQLLKRVNSRLPFLSPTTHADDVEGLVAFLKRPEFDPPSTEEWREFRKNPEAHRNIIETVDLLDD